MTSKNIDELAAEIKYREEENSRLKEIAKSQRDKIDSLLKELEEEKRKDNYHFGWRYYHESRYMGCAQ